MKKFLSMLTVLVMITILVIPATAQEARGGNACPMCGENGMVTEYSYTGWVMYNKPTVCGHGDMTATDQQYTRDVSVRHICQLCKWGGGFTKYCKETYTHCNKDGRDYPITRTYY